MIVVFTSGYFCTRFIRFATSFQAGIQDPVVQQQTKRILIETGKFFQAQDDYLDCFGDPKVQKKHKILSKCGKVTSSHVAIQSVINIISVL